MKVDTADITGALRKVFSPGDVFEIRILDALTAQLMRPHVVSGYFDYDHIEAAADELRRLNDRRYEDSRIAELVTVIEQETAALKE